MNNLQLAGIKVNELRFVSTTSGKRKRQVVPCVSAIHETANVGTSFSPRSAVNQCAGAANTLDPIFTIVLSLSYPTGCTSPACRNKYGIAVQYAIAVAYQRFNLTLTFNGGRNITIPLIFCSFASTSTSEQSYFVCSGAKRMVLFRQHHRSANDDFDNDSNAG